MKNRWPVFCQGVAVGWCLAALVGLVMAGHFDVLPQRQIFAGMAFLSLLALVGFAVGGRRKDCGEGY